MHPRIPREIAAWLGTILVTAAVFALISLFPSFWGRLLGPVRRAWLRLRLALRRRDWGRARGARYCPECGSRLAAAGRGLPPAFEACPGCEGVWVPAAALAEALASRGRPVPAWTAHDLSRASLACPECRCVTRSGSFAGFEFLAHSCPACRAYWLERIDWVSLEINLLR